MYDKSTDDLEKVLKETHPSDISEYISTQKEELMSGDRDFTRYMKELFRIKKVTKQEVILNADISLRYGYKLLNEEKVTRQRDVILRICFAAGFSLEETQRALKIYHMDCLYARYPRDALLITCFENGYTNILKINKLLTDNRMSPLRTSGVQE